MYFCVKDVSDLSFNNKKFTSAAWSFVFVQTWIYGIINK